MDLQTLLALTGLATSMTWTPGPNNMMLAASGANFGWRRTLPHALGVSIGFPVMLIAVSLGLGQVFQAWPALAKVLGWIGFLVVLWFAWRIGTADAASVKGPKRPLNFLQACAFQWVNPKAWTFAVWTTATYAIGWQTAVIAALVFLGTGLASSQAWVVLGAWMGTFLGTGLRLRVFNVAMAVLLVIAGAWLMLAA